MIFDTLKKGLSGNEQLNPMMIASNSLLTAREKLDLLNQLKADAAGAESDGRSIGFEPEEIDAAIAHVHEGVAEGVGSETVLKGDY